ncbi:hypothetical protein V499_03637, partial [Pseudogymnoascus sp. VKM F-103]
MDLPSDDTSCPPCQPNGTDAAATQTPHSDAVASILATTPDWRTQAGPSPAATAGEIRGQAAPQAANAGPQQGQAAAGHQAQAAFPAATTGQQFGVQAAAAAGHQGQIGGHSSQIGGFQNGFANTTTSFTFTTGTTSSSAFATTTSNQTAAIANQSRTRYRTLATTDFNTPHPTYHAHPSPFAATTPAARPIPRIVITTPDMRTHAPDSPTLHRARQPAHRRLRRHELQNRIAEHEQRIREMSDEADAQEMVTEALWVENEKLKRKIRELEGEGERRA